MSILFNMIIRNIYRKRTDRKIKYVVEGLYVISEVQNKQKKAYNTLENEGKT